MGMLAKNRPLGDGFQVLDFKGGTNNLFLVYVMYTRYLHMNTGANFMIWFTLLLLVPLLFYTLINRVSTSNGTKYCDIRNIIKHFVYVVVDNMAYLNKCRALFAM